MAIPKYDELRISTLKMLMDGRTMKMKDFMEPMAKEFSLTEEEVNEMYPSPSQKKTGKTPSQKEAKHP